MSWLSSFIVAVLTSAVAGVAGGFVASACVDWYRIPAREGASGYFVVIIALLSCFAGFFGGLILSRFSGGGGFVKGLGVSSGVMVALAAVAAAIAWFVADIPPTIDGHQLDLMVEVRLPIGAPKPGESGGYISLAAASGPGRPLGEQVTGTLGFSQAHPVDGRWIVPGAVSLFTSSRTRMLIVVLGGDNQSTGFELPLPRHPNASFEKWSAWLPEGTAQKPWPDTNLSYRFRIQPRGLPEDALTIDQQFAALTPDAPLEAWFVYFTNGRNPERDKAIAKVAAAHPADLAALIRDADYQKHDPAIYAAGLEAVADPQVTKAMSEVGAEIQTQIRDFNYMTPLHTNYLILGNEIRNRFTGWSIAWKEVCKAGKLACRPPLEEIARLAEVQEKDSDHMHEIALNARAMLNDLQ